MKLKIATIISSLILMALIFVACKKKTSPPTDEPETPFDKPGMLVNYADKLILPKFQAFKTSFDSLVTSFNNFAGQKNSANLQDLRQKYIVAYVKFQQVSTSEYGPSETENLRTNLNTYPVDTQQVNANIRSGVYNLNTVDNIDAKGFPAVDYLLYGKNESDASLLSQFESAPGRTGYLNVCMTEMQNRINNIVNAWKGDYKNTFVNSTGSQIGSSLGLIVNQLNFEIDLLKNGKIGIPLGKKSMGELLPEKCEAFYTNNISVRLAKECLQNIEDVYMGRTISDADGLGIDDYLQHLDAKHGSETLNDAIKKQFAIAKTKLDLVPEPLSSSIATHTALVDSAYMEIVKLLVLLKTDTPSALGIVITYQDSDGD